MKKLIFLIAAVLLSTAQLYSQWIEQSTPVTVDIYSVFPVSPTTVYAVSDNEVVLKTTNAGTNWAIIRQGPLTNYDYSDLWFFNESTGIAVGGVSSPSKVGVISKTTNGGVNWKDTLITGKTFSSVYFVNATTGFAGGVPVLPNSPLYKTTNAGVTWFSIAINASNIYDIKFINENTGWASATAAGVGEVVIKTTDGGANWSTVSTLGGSVSLTCIEFVNENAGWIGGNAYPYALLRKTTNGGTNFAQQTHHSTNFIWDLFFLNENIGWAVGEPQLIQKTTNGGINWNMQTSPSAWWIWKVRFFDANIGWACGSQGKIFYTSNGGGPVSVQNISTEVPSAYSLKQNYPNPFNPVTKIQYSITKNGFVKLVVFDALGREVETLVNEVLQPGTYETAFDGSKLNSGVYFYKLTSGDFSETKRMLMIK